MSSHIYPRIEENDSMIFYFDAGNPRSYPGTGTTVNDLSRTNNTITLNGPIYSTASPAPSFEIDGTTDEIDCGNADPLNNLTAFTISMGIRLMQNFTDGTLQQIFSKTSAGLGSIDDGFILFHRTTNNLEFVMVTGATQSTLSLSRTLLQDGKPHIIDIVWTGLIFDGPPPGINTGYLYLDGNLQSTTTSSSDYTNYSGANLFIGDKPGTEESTTAFFRTYFFRIHNKELSETQIKKNFKTFGKRLGIAT